MIDSQVLVYKVEFKRERERERERELIRVFLWNWPALPRKESLRKDI